MTIKNVCIGLLSLCLFFNISFAQPTAPEIFIDPSFHEAWVWPNSQHLWTTTISNTGNVDLSYSFPGFLTGSHPPGFIVSVDPASGIIQPGGSSEVLVTWDATGYAPGIYYQDLVCESNDPLNPFINIGNKMHVYIPAYIRGIVTDAISLQALSGVTVTVGSWQTHTLSDGSYIIAVDAGTYVIYYEKLGYVTFDVIDTGLIAGDTTVHDVELYPEAYPVPWVTADPVDCNDPVPSEVNWTLPTGPVEISYDDGTYEDLYAWALPGGECAVKFTPSSYPCDIFGGRIQVGDGSWPAANWMGSSFTMVAYDEDVNGMPGNVIDSVTVAVNNYGWIEFWCNTMQVDSGNFFLSFKQLNASPNCAPVGIDLDAPLENRSYMKAPGGNWQFSIYQDFMIRAFVDQVALPSNVVNYTLARISDFDPNLGPQLGTMTILTDTTATNYQDDDFPTLSDDWYAYAVKVNYISGLSSQWTYSNIIGMHKGKIVEIHLSNCLGTPISDAEIRLTGEDYPFCLYEGVTDASGSCIFECTWAGLYDLDIYNFGYENISIDYLFIGADTIIGFEWDEISWTPRNLWVDDISGTVYWDDPVVTALSEDFEGYIQYPWQMTTNGQGWFQTTNGSSLNFPILPWNSQYICVNDDAAGSSNDGSVDYLITHWVDLSGTEEFHMTFDSFFTGVNGQLATVEYSYDAGASWNAFHNMSPNMQWTSVDLDLSVLSGASAPDVIWFAFHADDAGNQASGWAIDNVEILAEIIDPENYQIFLDSTLVATTDTNFYQFENLTFGHEYSACVAAVYPCGVSDLVCVDFTSLYLRAPEWIQGDSVGNEAEICWFMDTSNILSDILGYNIYRDSILIDFVEYLGGDTSWYTDTPPDPLCYDYHVSALYNDLNPGDTVESAYTGPEEVCLVFGAMLPLFQDWTYGTFEPDWTAGENWVVNGQIGNAEPSAEFTWDPILNDYEECIVSGPINGVYPETKSDPYTDGQFMLRFDVQLDDVNATGNEYFKAEVWSNGEWNTISAFSNANGSFAWETVEVDITEYAMGHVFKLRFMAVGEESSEIISWFVDNIEVFHYCAPPVNLNAEWENYYEDIRLSWSPPESSAGCLVDWIYWDDGDYCNAIGLTGGGTFSVASHWDPDMIKYYDGYSIIKMRFIPGHDISNTQYILKVWKGTNADTLLYEELLDSVVPGEWNMITLSEPVEIDISQDLWIGYTCTSPENEFPAGHDFGPGVTGYGDMVRLDTSDWQSIYNYGSQFSFNWNIRALVEYMWDGPNISLNQEKLGIKHEVANHASKSVLGYNIFLNLYQDDYEFLDFTTDTSYLYPYEGGTDLFFYVTTVYQSCESEASNETWLWIGLEENKSDLFIKVYPNPTDDRINIESDSPITKLCLLDLTGHTLVVHEAVHQNQATMDVSSLASGVYLLTIDTEEGRVVRKVVVE